MIDFFTKKPVILVIVIAAGILLWILQSKKETEEK